MTKLYYAYSTLANDQRYVNYQTGAGNLLVEGESVTIKGGAGVADKRLFTPLGVVTTLQEKQVELLKQNTVFKAHEANGFIIIRDTKVDEEVAAADMTSRDESAPLVDGDFSEKQAPKTSKKTNLSKQK